eukprot:768481-Hanusia_phi.AAC.2
MHNKLVVQDVANVQLSSNFVLHLDIRDITEHRRSGLSWNWKGPLKASELTNKIFLQSYAILEVICTVAFLEVEAVSLSCDSLFSISTESFQLDEHNPRGRKEKCTSCGSLATCCDSSCDISLPGTSAH